MKRLLEKLTTQSTFIF